MTSNGTKTRGAVGTRRWLELAGWIALITLLWGTDLVARLGEAQQDGIAVDRFRLVSEQVTSALAALAMVLFVVQWLRLFPLTRNNWIASVPGHIAGSVLFAFGHYSLIVLFRYAWYRLNDIDYIWREPFVANLFVEYQKDIKIYLGMLVVITAYRILRGDEPANAGSKPVLADRLLVQTGSGEKLLRFADIDYLEAARNYVSIFAGGREYVVRDTLASIADRLPGEVFLRTHRSYIVNVAHVSELKASGSGHCVVLRNGKEVPLSRSYRDAFRSRFAT